MPKFVDNAASVKTEDCLLIFYQKYKGVEQKKGKAKLRSDSPYREANQKKAGADLSD